MLDVGNRRLNLADGTSHMSSTIRIEPFDAHRHLDHLLEVLVRVKASSIDYPPSIDTDGSVESLSTWLLRGGDFGRWVATDDSNVVGHVLLNDPANYLKSRLDPTTKFAEIARLFVDPVARSNGAGSLLLDRARNTARALSRRPVLAVVTASVEAIKLYQNKGFTTLCEFDGVHGRNLVMVDER